MIREYKGMIEYLTAVKFNSSLHVMGITDVAKHFGIGRAAVEQQMARGSLDGIRIDKSLYVSLDSFRNRVSEYEAMVSAIEACLAERAKVGKTIPYSEVMQMLGLDHVRSADRKKIAVMLGDLSGRTYEKNGILLSVLVVKKGTDYPSDGFYGLVESLGIEMDDEDTYHIEETERVFKHYGFRG